MIDNNRWLLPEGIEELLPPQAEHLERLRRQLLGLFHSWGYELVITPLVEYVGSLLIGRGDDLDLQTYKLTDQLNGRLMGVRADITPQVARIDAHHLKREVPTRLCYVGAVLHTRPEGFSATREPIQVGAELYGYPGIEGDVEVLHLMVETLITTGVENIHIDLGHVGILRGLATEAGLNGEQEAALFEAVQRKAKPDMMVLLAESGLGDKWCSLFMALVDLYGDETVLTEAQSVLRDAGSQVQGALEELRKVAAEARRRLPLTPLHYDLAELRGYQYKTGIVFAAFVPGHGQELARGGRYDEVGRVYGRARPATGFSTDLKTLIRVSAEEPYETHAILAPYQTDSALQAKIEQLRKAGERVISYLPGQRGDEREQGCDRKIVLREGEWEVVRLEAPNDMR